MHKHEQGRHNHDHSEASEHTSHSHGDVSELHKLIKIVEHWIHHNEEHAASYRDWAYRTQGIAGKEVGGILEEVARTTQAQNDNFRKILELLKGTSSIR